MPLKFDLNPMLFKFTLLETAPKFEAELSSVTFDSSVVFSLQLEFSAVWLHSVVLVSVEFDSFVSFVELEFSVVLVEFNT
jgi:hypothetical protein